LEKLVKHFKDYEHGKLDKISGKEIDELKIECENYRKKMKEIREKLEIRMQEHTIERIHEEMIKVLKNIFGEKGQDALIKDLNEQLVKKGKMKPRMTEIAKEVLKIRKKAKNKKLTPAELQRIGRDVEELNNSLIEYSQRKELVSAQKGVIQILYNGKKAELVLCDSSAFFVEDGKIRKVGEKAFVDSDKKELEEAITKTRDKLQVKLNSNVLNVLKKEIGDFEIIL